MYQVLMRISILFENIAMLENIAVLEHCSVRTLYCSVKTLPGFYKSIFDWMMLISIVLS